MKKAVALILIIACALAFGSCKKDAEKSKGETGSDVVVTAGDTTEDGTEKATESDSRDKKEKKSKAEEKDESFKTMSMDVYMGNSTFRVEDSDRVAEIYKTLSNLEYEKTDDVKFENGVGVYFQDESEKEVKSYYFNENYLRIDGQPETYKITDEGYNYEDLCNKIRAATNENFEEWR